MPSAVENLWHLFLPALTIGIAVTPILTRNLRATFIQQRLDADYAMACRSKGLSEKLRLSRHVPFWNSLLPTVNLLGVVVAFLIGGTVVVENVFNIPGLSATCSSRRAHARLTISLSRQWPCPRHWSASTDFQFCGRHRDSHSWIHWVKL